MFRVDRRPLIVMARSLPNESVLLETSTPAASGLTAAGGAPGSSSRLPPNVSMLPGVPSFSKRMLPAVTSEIFAADGRVMALLIVMSPAALSADNDLARGD